MYIFIYSIILHISFSAIVSGYMDWADCFLVFCFHFSFFHFLIYSSKTGLALLQYSQLKWGCDSSRLLCQVPSGRRNWEMDCIGVSNKVVRSSLIESYDRHEQLLPQLLPDRESEFYLKFV